MLKSRAHTTFNINLLIYFKEIVEINEVLLIFSEVIDISNRK